MSTIDNSLISELFAYMQLSTAQPKLQRTWLRNLVSGGKSAGQILRKQGLGIKRQAAEPNIGRKKK